MGRATQGSQSLALGLTLTAASQLARIAENLRTGSSLRSLRFSRYFKDPFLAYIYLAFVPFFVGLYQAFNILGYARRDEIFLQHSVRALRIIKYCALTTAIFILGAEAYLFIFIRGKDDIAGGVMMGVFIILVSAIIATAAAVFERILQKSAAPS